MFDSDSEEEKTTPVLKINEKYATKYDQWRSKEEQQKRKYLCRSRVFKIELFFILVKDRYGDVDLNEDYPDSSSTDESEDEDAKEWNENMEKNFLTTLSLIKGKNEKIYKKDTVLFDEAVETAENPKTSKNSNKPFYLKDLEREMVLKK